jgi:hypothetical protein
MKMPSERNIKIILVAIAVLGIATMALPHDPQADQPTVEKQCWDVAYDRFLRPYNSGIESAEKALSRADAHRYWRECQDHGGPSAECKRLAATGVDAYRAMLACEYN